MTNSCLPGASSSGWRLGKCARCATCPSSNWPSRPAAQSPPLLFRSLCPELRTWCSRTDTVHKRPAHKHPFTGTPGQLGVRARTEENKTVLLQPSSSSSLSSSPPVFAFIHKRIFFTLAPAGNELFLSTWTMRTKADAEELSFMFLSQPKHFSGDTSDRRKKNTQAKNFNTLKSIISSFFFF